MNNRIFIYAYTNLNLGDDLFIRILCDRYPESKFFIICNRKVSNGLKKIHNLKILPQIRIIDGILSRIGIKFSVNQYYKKLISYFCDVIVVIGGSIFQQPKDIKIEIREFKNRMIKDKPFYIIGANFGPYTDKNYYKSYKKIFEDATDVCFRDKYSYELFKDLPNVRYAPDVVFSYSPNNKKLIKKQVAISVISLAYRTNLKVYENDYINTIIEIAKQFSKCGYFIYFIGFCKYEGDLLIIKHIEKILKKEGILLFKSHNYNGDIDHTLNIISESEIVVATRFHAAILGLIYNKKILPIIYNEKTENVLNDIGLNNLMIRIKELNSVNLKKLIEQVIKNEPFNIMHQIKSAEMQFVNLDKLLKNK